MTGVDKIKEVRQLKYIQGLPIREISRRINLSRNTIRKILRSQQTKLTYQRTKTFQPITGKVKELIESWVKEDIGLKKKHRRTAWRMYEILRYEYDYAGSYESIALCVRNTKHETGNKVKEAYIPLVYDAGDAFQFDWGEVTAYIDGKLETLQLAVMVLCHSRHFYLRVYPCQKQELMLDVHRRAFEYFGGICRRGIYDNLKTAVRSLLKGYHRNLQERFVRFCSHYLYEPEFCNPARGNEKGRVENMVGYVRRNFFVPIPHFSSLEELNERLISFSVASSRTKPHPEFITKTRYEIYQEERKRFIELPVYGFECCRTGVAVISPYSTVYFEDNRYSVPSEYVGKTAFVKGYSTEVVITYEGREIARHKRVYAKKQQIFNPYHYLGVLSKKPRAFKDGLPFKNWKLPEVFLQYRKLLNDKYEDGDKYFAKTLILLKEWSIKDIVNAINQAITMGILGDSYILTLLRQSEQAHLEKEYLSIKIELSRYSAKQKPLSHYDEVLRNRIKDRI